MTSYEKILEVFWSTQNHCVTANSRQYMSAVFCADEAQKNIAIKTRDRVAIKSGASITTPVLPLGDFYLAEGYHQKYMFQQHPDLMREMTQIYPRDEDYLHSTAATRINAYLGGHGTRAQLEKEIDGFGLSAKGRDTLRSIVRP